MSKSFASTLRDFQQIHSRCENYLRFRNVANFQVNTPDGKNACDVLFKSFEDYLDCVIKNNPQLSAKHLLLIQRYKGHIADIRRYTSAFNGQRYIGVHCLTNVMGSWQKVWDIRKAFKADSVYCPAESISATHNLLFP